MPTNPKKQKKKKIINNEKNVEIKATPYDFFSAYVVVGGI